MAVDVADLVLRARLVWRHVVAALIFRADPAAFGRLLRGMLGAALVPALSEEEMRWEDDGGPMRPAQDGYTHTFHALSD